MSMRSGLRHFSTSILSTKQKSRAALDLLKSESNPERILDICRSASLTPDTHLDRRALSLAVSKLASANHFSGIRTFLDDLKTRPDLRNEKFLSHAIVLYGQANMLDHAVRTFTDDLPPPRSVHSFNSLLFAAILSKNYQDVSRFYLQFPSQYSIQPNLDTYNTVLKAFSESGSTTSFYSLLTDMDKNNVKPNVTTLNIALSGFYNEHKFEEVGKVLKLMEDNYRIFPSISTYNVRLLSLCKLKRASEAKALFEGMVCNGRKPNSVSYACLIHGFCKQGDLEEAKSLFKDMKRRGFLPDGDCYFTLVHFLCLGGEFEPALVVAKECIGKAWVPNFSTMKTLVNGLAGVGKVDEAKDLIKQIKEKFAKNGDKWDEIEAGLLQSQTPSSP